MVNLWVYVVCYLAGWLSALLLLWYTDQPEIVQHVNKIKQKGGPGNTMNTQVEFTKESEKTKAELRKEKRDKRKSLRQQKREENNN
jgi:hypothetical protein